jgi:hypothetical protein
MIRDANGAAFESRFGDCMRKYHHTLRLPTLNTGYSGSTQPADFIVVGQSFNYVELKETKSAAFSVSSMAQLPEARKFMKEQAMYVADRAVREGEYYLIVHFMSPECYKVAVAKEIDEFASRHETLKPSSKVLTFMSLDELCGGLRV